VRRRHHMLGQVIVKVSWQQIVTWCNLFFATRGCIANPYQPDVQVTRLWECTKNLSSNIYTWVETSLMFATSRSGWDYKIFNKIGFYRTLFETFVSTIQWALPVINCTLSVDGGKFSSHQTTRLICSNMGHQSVLYGRRQCAWRWAMNGRCLRIKFTNFVQV